jgi:hypothetical protein
MEDIIRQPVELIDEDLDLVAGGGRFDFDIGEVNIGVGQVNVGSVAFLNTNLGVGENNGIIV